jgi:pimeloyl-ACP methyl ester carboxylesterase
MLNNSTKNLFIKESGPDSAPTIIFLHGGGGEGWMWNPQVQVLSDYHCLVPDLPEHGKSLEIKPFTITSSTEMIADLIRLRAHNAKAHVVGLSLGAQITAALLALAPEVAASAFISSALVHPIPGMKAFTPKMLAATYRWGAAPFLRWDWFVRLNMRYAAGVPYRYFTEFRETSLHLTADSFGHAIYENQLFRLPTGLDKVHTPVLVVAGKGEYGGMRQSVKDLASAIPGAKGYLVEHKQKLSLAAQHNWNLTAPQLFNRTLRAWIEGSPLPEELRAVKLENNQGL